jgi:Ca2+-binding EF-hand superfamily protein
VNKNNVITYTEFLAAVLEMHGKVEEYRFAEAFDQLDCDSSGYSKYWFLVLFLTDCYLFYGGS